MAAEDFTLPEGTHTVALGLGDLNGIMRGKRIPASNWDNICKNGNALSAALFAIDMTCDVWDTPYVNMDNGYPDMHLFPITKPVSLPWEPGVALAFARAEGMDHKPVPIDPRQVLIRQLDRAEKLGVEIKVGAELEFYLLDPETGMPKDKGNGVYSLMYGSRGEVEFVKVNLVDELIEWNNLEDSDFKELCGGWNEKELDRENDYLELSFDEEDYRYYFK